MPASKSGFVGVLQTLGVALLWAHILFPGVSAKVVNYLEQGFFFDWYGDQSPPIPTAAQCDTLHITWGRRTATGPNPAAPYYLQIYTSTFIVPFVIPAGDDTAQSFDWVVPFVPGTQFQMCMVASNGVTGGCQAVYTVYQRPNTTLDNPPTCFNLTYPHAPLGVKASLTDGSWSQYGWIDQCSDISLTPTNGTPPYTYTIAPALHPPFNITSNTMDTVNWTVSLMYGMPFFVSVTDADGVGWTNGPLHPSGGGSTSCLDLDAALDPRPSAKSDSISPGGAAGIAVGTLILGALIGLLGAILFFRWQGKRHPSARPFEFGRKFSDFGDIPTLGMHPGSAASTTFARNASSGNPDEQGLLAMGSPGSPDQSATFSSMPSASMSDRDRGEGSASPIRHQHSPSAGSFTGPTSPSTIRSPMAALGQSGSQVYVVHHDAGRPPPVTVFTSDGTEVVELPPQYESAAGPQRPGQGSSRPLPTSPPPPRAEGQRRAPRGLPPKPVMVAMNGDPPSRSHSPS